MSSHWQELEHKYYMRTFNRTPVVLVKGKGVRVWDEEGKEYIDFVAGWAVDSLGHCHPEVSDAIAGQASTLIQTSNQFYTIPQLRLAELLIENSCLDQVFFCNSGAEATEGAVKLARRYGKLNLNGAYEVITATGSFHGRTLAMVAASGQEKFQQPYIPLPSGFVNVQYDNIEAIKSATTDKTCAVMLEPLQGEGGVNVPNENYLAKVQAWCEQSGILFILDEIQTGIGRIGTLFAYEQYDVEPDIMTLAKGLGSGVAIGAILAKEKASVFSAGEHGSTFGGNPLACAAGYATVKYILDNNIIDNVKKTGEHFVSSLKALQSKFPIITDVRGKGLLLAIEFKNDIAPNLVTACLKRGLLVNQLKPNALRFMPPLVVTTNEIDEGMAILKAALSSINS